MVRNCTLRDEQTWLKLNKEFIEFEYQEENVWENPLDKGDMSEVFRQILNNHNSANRLFMIEEAGRIIGFMNTAWFLSIWAHGKVLFLDDFFITKEFRGQGYGKKAIKELEVLIKSEGYVRLQLMAENTNPGAVRFYEREDYSKQIINFFCKYI